MEGFSNQESVSREVLVEVLKERGLDDIETREMLIRWTEEQERIVEQEGTREAQLNFEIQRAELYLDAGFVDDGRQALEDALTIAVQEGLDSFVDQIEQKLSVL